MESVSDQAMLNRRWRPALMAFFLRRVRDHAEAEDLTQEVFVRLLDARGDVAARAPDAYVFQVAANLLTDRARRAKVRHTYRESLSHLDYLGIETLDPSRVAIGRAGLTALAACLEQLPERTRTIFTLYKIENMGKDAIAEAYGISTSAVKQHIMKAMAFLMKQMRDVR